MGRLIFPILKLGTFLSQFSYPNHTSPREQENKAVTSVYPRNIEPPIQHGGDKGNYKLIEDESGQFFRFSFYCGGCFKEILAFLLVSLYLALLLGLCCVILVLLCSQRRAERERGARI